jgi:hypothetical protein
MAAADDRALVEVQADDRLVVTLAFELNGAAFSPVLLELLALRATMQHRQALSGYAVEQSTKKNTP